MSDTHWGEWVEACDEDACEHAGGVVHAAHWTCCGLDDPEAVCADADEEDMQAVGDDDDDAQGVDGAAGGDGDMADGLSGLLAIMKDENFEEEQRQCMVIQRAGRGLLSRRRLFIDQVEILQRACRVARARARVAHLRRVRAIVDTQAATLDTYAITTADRMIRRIQRVCRAGQDRPRLFAYYGNEMRSRLALFRFIAGWGDRNRTWRTLVARVAAAQAEWDAARGCEDEARQAVRQMIYDVRVLPQHAVRPRSLKEKVNDVLAYRANLRPSFPAVILPAEMAEPVDAAPLVQKEWALRPDAFDKPKPRTVRPQPLARQPNNLPPSFPPNLDGPPRMSTGTSLIDDYLFIAALGEPMSPPMGLHFINRFEGPLREEGFEPGMLRVTMTLGDDGQPIPVDVDYSLADEGLYLINPVVYAEGFHMAVIRVEEARGIAGVGGNVWTYQVAVDVSTSKMLTDPTAREQIPRHVWQMVRKLRLVMDETGTQNDARVVALLAKIRAERSFGDVLRYCQSTDNDCFWLWELYRERKITRMPAQLRLPAIPAELKACGVKFVGGGGPASSPALSTTPPPVSPSHLTNVTGTAASTAMPAYPTTGALFDNPSQKYPIKTLSKLDHADYLPASYKAEHPAPAPVAHGLAPLGPGGKLARRRLSVGDLLPWIPGGRRKVTPMQKCMPQIHEQQLRLLEKQQQQQQQQQQQPEPDRRPIQDISTLPPLRLAPSAHVPLVDGGATR